MHFIFSISNIFLLFVRDFCFLLCTHKKHSPWHFDFHFLKQNSFPWLWIEWSSVMFFGRLNRYPGILLCLNLVLIIPVRIILQVCLMRLLEVLGLHFTYFSYFSNTNTAKDILYTLWVSIMGKTSQNEQNSTTFLSYIYLKQTCSSLWL